MNLSFISPACEVKLIKNGAEVTREEWPSLYNSIASVRCAESGSATNASLAIVFTPALDSAFEMLRAGLFAGYSQPNQSPSPEKTSGKTSVSATAVPVGPAGAAAGSSSGGASPQVQTADSSAAYWLVRFHYTGTESSKDGKIANDNATKWYAFSQQLPPDLDFGNGEVSITVNAQGGGIYLTQFVEVYAFDNVPLLKVVESLAKRTNVKIAYKTDDSATPAALAQIKIVQNFADSPLNVIKKLLNRYGFFFTVTTGEPGDTEDQQPSIVIQKVAQIFTRVPSFEFVVFRQADVANKAIPCISFRADNYGQVFHGGSAFGVYTKGVNTKTKLFEPEAKQASDEQLTIDSKTGGGAMPKNDGSGAPIGAQIGPDEDASKLTAGAHFPAVKRDKNLNSFDEVSAIVQRGRLGTNGLKYILTVPGLPLIDWQDTITIRVADMEDGLTGIAVVQGITHTYDSSGWTTEITADTATSLIDPINTKKAETPAAPTPPSGSKVKSKGL